MSVDGLSDSTIEVKKIVYNSAYYQVATQATLMPVGNVIVFY
jgi:hypothetical protein